MNMTATNHTEHYGLSQYTENDRPTYTGDYNGDMSKIDAAIYSVTQAIASAIADRLTAGDIKSGNGINIDRWRRSPPPQPRPPRVLPPSNWTPNIRTGIILFG